MSEIIDLASAIKLLDDAGDQILSVTFRKRTTGAWRKINGRFEVKSALRGGPKAYDPASKNLKVIYDLQKKAYRSINLNDIVKLTLNGVTYSIKTE